MYQLYRFCKSDKYDDFNHSFAVGMGHTLLIPAFLFTFCGAVYNNGMEMAKIKYAPRIYLIEEAAKLIKK